MSGPRRIRDLGETTPVQEARSQAAFTLAIFGYAVGGALILTRALLLGVGLDATFWAGDLIIGTTDLVFSPLSRLPIATTAVVSNLTLLDLTAVVGVVMVPIGLLAFGSRQR